MTRARQHHRYGPTAALAVLTATLLAGCTPDVPAPQSTPTPVAESASPTAAPSPTPSPSPSETRPGMPERPAAMEHDDAEGAAAAAEYYLQLSKYALRSSDAEELAAMSHRACGYCSKVLDRIDWLKSNHATYSGGSISTTILETYQKDPVTTLYPFDVRLVEEPARVIGPDDNEIASAKGTDFVARIEVGRRDGAWVIATVAKAPAQQ